MTETYEIMLKSSRASYQCICHRVSTPATADFDRVKRFGFAFE